MREKEQQGQTVRRGGAIQNQAEREGDDEMEERGESGGSHGDKGSYR